MLDLISEAFEIQQFLIGWGWKFCFIGGIAVQAWGEPRLTRDIDLCVLAGYGSEEPFVDQLLASFEGRLPDARAFALRNRTMLLRSPGGIPVDVSLAALPFEEKMIERTVEYEFVPGKPLIICSAEDLIVLKLFAARETDIRDARSVMVRQPSLDWSYIEEWLSNLDELRGESGAVELLRRIRQALQ